MELKPSSISPLRFIVVSGKSEVEWVDIETPNKQSLLSALYSRYGNELEKEKSVEFKGGLYDSTAYVYSLIQTISHVERQASNSQIELDTP